MQEEVNLRFLLLAPSPSPIYTLTSTTSVEWGSSEATCVFSHPAAAHGAGPWGSVAAQYWGLLLNFAFPHSCFMAQPSDASHSGRLLFPPRNHFQVPALGIPNCSPHLCPPASDPESTDLRNAACAELRELWGLPLPIRLLGDRDGWVNGAVGEMFIFKPGSLIPVPAAPPSDTNPWGDKMQRMVDCQGLIPNTRYLA